MWSETADDVVEDEIRAGVGETKAIPLSVAANIDCHVIVYFGDDFDKRLEETLTIPWLEKSQYTRVKNTARTLAYELHQVTQPAEQQVYRQKVYRASTTTQLLKMAEDGSETPLGRVIVRHDQHWAERIPLLIGHHAAANPFAKLLLRIAWEFRVVTINTQDGTNLATEINGVVRTKSEKNWRFEEFLPKTELDAIFTDEIIRELIKMDTSLSNLFGGSDTCPDRREFARDVSNFATRLLAICINARIPLSCLHSLVCVSKLRDVNLPLHTCPESCNEDNFHHFRKEQERFTIYDFDQTALKRKMHAGGYETIPDGKVVPITGDLVIGQGSFGVVKEVRIHPDHHNFDEDVFALKELRTGQPLVSKEFKNESHVFSNLMEVRDPAILLPLAMWRQKNRSNPAPEHDQFYMLYPRARRNLNDYLRQFRKRPVLERDFVLNLMQQLCSLARGLDHIHRLTPSGLLGDGASLRVQRARDHIKGYHHDLKPDNILVFDDGSWKISDFGTARIVEVISGQSHSGVPDQESGDPVYGPPDRFLNRPSATKYDVWSFGCVILEILLTLFEEGTADQLDVVSSGAHHRLDVFYAQRHDSVQDSVGGVASYWYEDRTSGNCRLREPVERRLAMLERKTEDYDQFGALTKLVRSMLSIHASKRPSARDVYSHLKTIELQVTSNLREGQEDFYKRPGQVGAPFASNPSDNSRSERPQTPERHLSTPTSPVRHRRSSSASSRQLRPDLEGEDPGHLAHSGSAIAESAMVPRIEVTVDDRDHNS